MVAGWAREEQAGKRGWSGGSGVLGCAHAGSTGTGPAEIQHALNGMVEILGEAEPVHKTKIYAGSGLPLSCHPETRKVPASSRADRHLIGEPSVSEGGLEPFAHLLSSFDAPWLDLSCPE